VIESPRGIILIDAAVITRGIRTRARMNKRMNYLMVAFMQGVYYQTGVSEINCIEARKAAAGAGLVQSWL
jgi:hypothetical protein